MGVYASYWKPCTPNRVPPMLTSLILRGIKPTERQYKLTDGGGLYLLVHPNGGLYWRLKYRYGEKEKTLALGVYPAVTIREARERRDAAKKQITSGVDPAQIKKAQKIAQRTNAANSFEVIAREWFERNRLTWAASHSVKIIARLEKDVFPWIGSLPIVDIKAIQILETVRRIEQRGSVETAHRALRNCGQVFRYAVATGRAERDPTSDLRGALPPVQKAHFAAVTDPVELGHILRMFDAYKGSFIVKCAMQLMPMVFVRPGELRQAAWKDFNLELAEWRFIASKTKAEHIVPLSTQALSILKGLQPLTGSGRYVFPSARSIERPMSENAILAALRRLGIPKEDMCGHGVRAIARTILDEVLGFRIDLIEHQLAHNVRDPLGRAYNRTSHLPERRKMMQTWSDYLEGLKTDK